MIEYNFELLGKKYNGSEIVGVIDNKIVEGIIGKVKDKYYFFQDSFDGCKPECSYESKYKYSWYFRVKDNIISNDVDLDLDNEYYFTIKYGCIYVNKIKDFNLEKISRLFYFKEHYDCCGSFTCYGSSEMDLDNLDKEKLRKSFNKFAKNKPFIAHIPEEWEYVVKYYKKLGFNQIYKYINPNSDNTICILQYDPIKIKENN